MSWTDKVRFDERRLDQSHDGLFHLVHHRVTIFQQSPLVWPLCDLREHHGFNSGHKLVVDSSLFFSKPPCFSGSGAIWGYFRAITRSSRSLISINHPSNVILCTRRCHVCRCSSKPLAVPFTASNCSNSRNPLEYWVPWNVPDSPEHLDERHWQDPPARLQFPRSLPSSLLPLLLLCRE